jgi:hypothetical protein
MSSAEINRLVELLGQEGRDHPKTQEILAAAEVNPAMAGMATRLLRIKLINEGGDPSDPGSLPIAKQLPAGVVPLGMVMNGRLDGPVFSIPEGTPSDLQHVGVFGLTRYGKSTILQSISRHAMLGGNPVWGFDMENESSRLTAAVSGPNRPVGLKRRHLRICFFQPPGDWISPRSWLETVSLLLRGETFLRDGSQNLFNDILLNLLRSKGALSGSNRYPSLAEMLSYLKGVKLSGSEVRGKTWLESLINRFTMLCNAFRETSHVTSSNMLQLLADKSVIFRFKGLRGVPLQFLTNFLITWLSCYKEGE